MSKVALVVELGMVPGQRDAFLERARGHAETCLEEEAGCALRHPGAGGRR